MIAVDQFRVVKSWVPAHNDGALRQSLDIGSHVLQVGILPTADNGDSSYVMPSFYPTQQTLIPLV